jgi:hypothetical protein
MCTCDVLYVNCLVEWLLLVYRPMAEENIFFGASATGLVSLWVVLQLVSGRVLLVMVVCVGNTPQVPQGRKQTTPSRIPL